MSRRPFLGTVVQDRAGNYLPNLTGAGTVWDSQVGGSQIVDLIDNVRAGSTDGFISTDNLGEINFQGPASGTSAVWIDFGAGRYYLEASDTTSRIDALETSTATMLQSSDFGVTTTGVPGPLDDSGLIPAAQIPTGSGGFAALGTDGNLLPSQLTAGVPIVIQYGIDVAGQYPLRSTRTSDATTTVIWKGPTDPTFAAGYALGGVDVWLQES